MRSWVTPPEPRKDEKRILSAMARASMAGMREATRGAQEEMRDDVLAAGFGDKLAKTIRSKVYPDGASASMAPAGIVWARRGKPGGRSAAAILGQYNIGEPIRPALGEAMAIPTKNVPRSGRGRRPMTPVEVEAYFNQDLILRPGKRGTLLGFVNAVKGRSSRRPGYKRATKGRVTEGRQQQLILMFVFVRQVPGRKLLNFKAIHARWLRRLPDLIAANFTMEG